MRNVVRTGVGVALLCAALSASAADRGSGHFRKGEVRIDLRHVIAVVVDEGWQRRGLGEHAMQTLVDTACSARLGWLHGAVLAQNLPMLALMRSCRFCCTPDRDDGGLVRAETSLTAGSRRLRDASVPAWRAWMPTWVAERMGAAVAGHA